MLDFNDKLIAEYKGYKITIMLDQAAENPWESWDCQTPLLRYYDGRIVSHDSGDNIADPFQYFSDGQIIRHQGKILAALGELYTSYFGGHEYTLESLLDEHVRDNRDYFNTMADCKREFFQETLAESIADSDKLETLAALYDIVNIPNLCTSTSGYLQGDDAELLLVVTPEHAKRCGGWSPSYDHTPGLKAESKLYGTYIWGDVYGYKITDSDGEFVDLCWGFYGSDHEESGLEESAISTIEYAIRNRLSARQRKLKQLIAARAPLAVRAKALESIRWKPYICSTAKRRDRS